MTRQVRPSETCSEMTWIVMPGQCNALGTAFGGQVMAWIDVCAGVAAQRFSRTDVVTASMDQLVFEEPIRKGQIVVLRSMVNWAGTTSMEVGVRVEAETPNTGERAHAASAFLTFVAVDDHSKPTPVPTLLVETDQERRRWEQAKRRRAQRLATRNKQ